MRTLAEIIEEWKRLRREFASTGRTATGDDPSIGHFRAGLALDKFYAEHGPRLLAVAEAGAKMRKTLDVLEYTRTSPRLSADVAAFDAAASGEGRG